jgi:hypothetical protein
MPARWSFEALAVEQFKNNKYEKLFFPYYMKISRNDWYASYLIHALEKDLYACRRAKTLNDTIRNNYKKLTHYIAQISNEAGFKMPESLATSFAEEHIDSLTIKKSELLLNKLSIEFKKRKREAMDSKDSLIRTIATNSADSEKLFRLKTDYYNTGLAAFVLNEDALDKYFESRARIIQKFEPGYMPPTSVSGRAHFCAPFKITGNMEIDTFWFNIVVIWLVSLLLYFALYFNILRKLISGFGNTNKRKSDSSFIIIKEISSW